MRPAKIPQGYENQPTPEFSRRREITSLESSDDREKLLEFMADPEHDSYYQDSELAEAIDLKVGFTGDSTYFSQLLEVMVQQGDIREDMESGTYSLPERLK